MVVIFAVSGALSFAGAASPASTDRAVFVGIGMCDLLVAALGWWTLRTPITGIWVLAVGAGIGLPVIAVAGRHDAMPSSAVFVVLLFVWVGANFPPGICWWLLPPAAAAYLHVVGPRGLGPEDWIPPLLVMLAGCVIVAETIARSMARLNTAEAQVRAKATQLRTLVDASTPLNSLDANLVLQAAVSTLLHLGHDAAAITLFDFKTRQLQVTHAGGDIPDGAAAAVAGGDRGITGQALRLDRTVVETDYPSMAGAIPAVAAAGFHTLIATPVRADHHILGVLLCASKDDQPTSADPEIVELLAAHVGRALRNATDYALQEINAAYHATQATIDPLTGVGNRRHAESLLSTLEPGDTVLLFDLDHFKGVNDTFGHAAGDAVLQDFARFLQSNIRYVDGVARLGGEEFLVIRRAMGPVTEEEPRLVEAWRATQPRTTVSAGLAVHHADRTPMATLAAADDALYAAKGQGRDRIVAASR